MQKKLYYEEFPTPMEAIEREKQIKRWSRSKKEYLIALVNPDKSDLSMEQNI